VDGSEPQVFQAIESAHKLNPDDYRAPWFRASHKCQTLEAKTGMNEFIDIEASLKWQEFPLSFWDDYIACAINTSVPAHGIRALNHVRDEYPTMADARGNMREILEKRITKPNITEDYDQKQVWESEELGKLVKFTNYTCGLSFVVNGEDELDLGGVKNSFCVSQISKGPYKGKKKSMSPTILLLARPAHTGETLEDFRNAIYKQRVFHDVPAQRCPADKCLSGESVKPGAYEQEGDGYVEAIIFEREMPAYPGLLLEKPEFINPSDLQNDKITYFRPNERITRFPGEMFYLVMLDSSESVLDKAKIDYAEFLKNLVVE
jgi:hypothetical protein